MTAPLRLEEAVELTLARAPEVAAALSERDVSKARRDQASSAYWPRAELSATYLMKWPENELPIELPKIPGIKIPEIPPVDDLHHFQGQLKLGYRLFDLSRGARVDAADHDVSSQAARVEELRAGLAFRTRAVFLAALLSRDVLKIAEQSLSVAEQDERRAVLAAEVGNGSALLVAQSRIRAATLRAQAEKARNELLRQTEQLSLLTGRRGPIELQGDLEGFASSAAAKPAEPEPPQLTRLREASLAVEELALSQRLSLVPTLSLFATAELQYPRGLEVTLGPVATVGAQLSFNIFDGFLREATAAELDARARQLGEGRRAAEDEVERRLVDLDARLRTASADKVSAEDRTHQSEVYVKVARAAAEAGTGTELEVRTAELSLDQAKLSIRQALFELALIRAERLQILGRAVEGNS
ncbi:MAG: TolC family protein [Deltaproteobacteria bacterium]|nr:TolC family protein [Deltaproteobacteria bacterium]